MLGNFSYVNPTKLYFGKDALSFLPGELARYGKHVVLVYGGGSIKRNGIYDQVMDILKKAGKEVTEISGVMSNPTADKLKDGVQIARKANVDFILAVGGGSCCHYDGDPWVKYFLKMEEPDCEIVPGGGVLTMVGTGSEMNAGSVITNHEQKLKIGHVFGEEVMPRFSILNPEFTMTVPQYQMISGIYDMFNHICEQYFSGDDDNSSDYLAEGLMRSVIHSSRIAVKDPKNYEARSNLMWDATWALNTLIGKGKTQDWMVHMLGQAAGAITNAAHGMTLAAVSLPYYRHILPYGLPKFRRFAVNVWNVQTEGKTNEEIAREGLSAMESWMKELGLVMNLTDLGATEEMIPDIVKATIILNGGYKTLTTEEVEEILKESL